MKSIILDSSALFSLASSADSNHTKALSIAKILANDNRMLILPTEVFSELMNIAGKKGGRSMQNNLYHDLIGSSNIILPQTKRELITLTYDKLLQLPTSVSFTDSLVMTYADTYETNYIFGFDEVFTKNGYNLPTTER